MGCTVKKFLCCISLETGGLIVGWINVILSFLAIIGLIVLLSLEVINYNHGSSSSQMNVVGSFVSLMIFYSIFIIYYLIVFIAAVNLIQGTKRRDHTKMVLFMILMAIGVILQFLQIIAAGWSTFISGLFMACVSAYFFLCIYSLYAKTKSEKMGQPYV